MVRAQLNERICPAKKRGTESTQPGKTELIYRQQFASSVLTVLSLVTVEQCDQTLTVCASDPCLLLCKTRANQQGHLTFRKTHRGPLLLSKGVWILHTGWWLCSQYVIARDLKRYCQIIGADLFQWVPQFHLLLGVVSHALLLLGSCSPCPSVN